MRADSWTRRALVRYVLSMPQVMGHARKGARLAIARKLIYGSVVARNAVVYSILRDIAGMEAHTSERVIELPLVEKMIFREDKNSRILEIGSGESPFVIPLAKKGYKILGIDIHDYPYSGSGIEFAKADLLLLPIKAESIDLAFAISTIEHVGIGYYGDRITEAGDRASVKELGRVLRTNGKLIITVPFGCKPIPDVERVYDAESIKDLLSGFSIVEEYYWVYEKGEWKRIPKESATVGPPLRENDTTTSGVIIAMATKQASM